MGDLILFGILAAIFYATWYWWPVSVWVIAGIGLYIVISEEIKWWRYDRPKARSAEERRRSYFSHWAARLGMLETASRLQGTSPLPAGKNFGSEYRRVVVVLVFYVGVMIVGATQFLGWDPEERYDVKYDAGSAGGGGNSNSASPASLPQSASIGVSAQDNASEHENSKEVIENGHGQELAQRPNPFASRPRELTEAEQRFIKTNFADDLARCRAFLLIHANGNPGLAKTVTRTPRIDEIDEVLAALVGAETAVAKFGLQFEAMSREMEGNYTHFSRLIVKHAQFCADLQRDPMPRFEYWMARARQLQR